MPRRLASIALAVLVAVPVGVLVRAQSQRSAAAQPVSFATQIAPILETHCLSCHGDTVQQGPTRAGKQLFLFLRSHASSPPRGTHGSRAHIPPGAVGPRRS